MTKALVLLSGWLDSVLALKVLESQWIDCTAITFHTPFFWKTKAEKLATSNWFKIKFVDISKDHLEVVKNPKYWYWKNMNPCIDCHWFMIKTAAKIAKEEWYDVIASWEVLGQRPMSQTTRWLNSVNKVSWVEILRPLCAKHLPETSYEKLWLVDREKLLDISWRWRQKQMQLAKEFWLKDFEMPWGWCLLTQEWYSEKLKSLLDNFKQDIVSIDTELIKYWRLKVFNRWFVILWRDNTDNEKLHELAKDKKEYKIARLVETTWPLATIKIIKDWFNENDIINFYRERVQKLQQYENLSIKYI